MDRILRLLTWPAALFIAEIFLWSQQYKLTANPGSVELFTTLATWLRIPAYEAPFRLTVAWSEIATAVLLINQPSRMWGAAGAFALMSGAIFFHVVSPLGIDPYNDGGSLFKDACAAWASAAFILFAYRAEGFALLRRVLGRF